MMRVSAVIFALLVAAACGDKESADSGDEAAKAVEGSEGKTKATDKPKAPTGPPPMVAKLEPKSGSTASGTVYFTQRKNVVTIMAKLEGLSPGQHGLHIHEIGDCSADDASSAGDHFDPHGAKHGKPEGPEQHVGDLGNIAIGADGKGEKIMGSMKMTLGPGDTSIAGRAVVVHAERDDLLTQPAGNAGAPVACGVIELDKQPTGGTQ